MTARALAAGAMLEADWQRLVTEAATMLGWHTFHVMHARGMNPGWPDLVLLRPPEALFVELKTERGRVTPAQKATLNELGACGLEVHLWRPSDERDVLSRLARR